ncbi:MAG: ABC transporter ATP-binding protein [bacterium]
MKNHPEQEGSMIQANGLSKCFGTQTVLKQLSIDLPEGQRVALIGGNGAGKTTLIRILLGQYVPAGELTVFGSNPRQDRMNVLRHIGFVPQNPPPLQMTVRELTRLSMALDPSGTFEEIRRCTLVLGLDWEAHQRKPFFKLSGGMKQKLLIALTLSRKPRLLIMDEPTANLDPAGRLAFLGELARLPETTGMLLSSHRVDELLGLIERVVELDQGQITLDQLVHDRALAGRLLECRVAMVEEYEPLRRVCREWSLCNGVLPGVFSGEIAATDRMRFLSALTPYSHQIRQLHLDLP